MFGGDPQPFSERSRRPLALVFIWTTRKQPVGTVILTGKTQYRSLEWGLIKHSFNLSQRQLQRTRARTHIKILKLLHTSGIVENGDYLVEATSQSHH